MEIECPKDYDYITSENRVFSELETYRAPEPFASKKTKRKRKRPMELEKEISLAKPQQKKEKENYFQKMYREANKKMYINLFVRKIKQGLVGRHNPGHRLLEDG